MNYAVLYARYSSDKQTEQSIEGQLAVCKEFATLHGYTIVGEYIDRAITGKTDKRPEFQRMIAESDGKNFQYVIVYKLDRFSRNSLHSKLYKHALKQKGVKVLSATEVISDSMEGQLIESILEWSAEMYTVDLSEKVTRGMRESAKKEYYNGGGLPIGYKVVDKKVVIDTERAEIAKYIFDRYSQGVTKRQIVTELNAKHYLTNKGNKFTENSLYNMLSNRKYIGECSYLDIDQPTMFEPIIDKAMFDLVQERLKQNKHAPATAKAKTEYMLYGKAFCGYCGEHLIGVSGYGRHKVKHNYYACSARWKKKSCNKAHERQYDLEQKVMSLTVDYILDAVNMDELVKQVERCFKESSTQKQITELEKRIAKIDKTIDRCMIELLDCESVELSQRLKSHSKDLEIQKVDIGKELRLLRAGASLNITREQMKSIIASLATGDIASDEHKRRIITTFINSVYVFDDKILIYYNFDPNDRQPTFAEMKEQLSEYECDSDIDSSDIESASVTDVESLKIEPCIDSVPKKKNEPPQSAEVRISSDVVHQYIIRGPKMNYEQISQTATQLKCILKENNFDSTPKVAIVLGSGLGDFTSLIERPITVHYSTLKNMPTSSVSGHDGKFVFGYFNGQPIACMQGRVHYYEGYSMSQVVYPHRVLAALKIPCIILTNAAGGINKAFHLGDLMLITDHICTVPSPLIGPNLSQLGTRFPDMSNVYDKETMQKIIAKYKQDKEKIATASEHTQSKETYTTQPIKCNAKKNMNKDTSTQENTFNCISLHQGIYIQVTGPQYETPAEINFYRQNGADAVGMSTAVEAIACHHAGMKVIGISCITNAAANSDSSLSHEDVKAISKLSSDDFQHVLSIAINAFVS